MPRSVISRSLGPFVAILWSLFLFWSVWTAAVWTLGIGATWLGFSAMPGGAPPPNADLRGAILVMAEFADVAWLALAAVNLHLVITAAHGLRTARAWFSIAAGGAFVLAAANNFTGIPFGWMSHYPTLGSRLFGISIGWMLLWTVLLLGARETALRLHPRASHRTASVLAAALVLLTFANLTTVARVYRAWWGWHTGDIRSPAAMPPWAWAAWFLCPLLLLLAMREKSAVTAASHRSIRPLIILAILNALALAVRLCAALG